MNHLRGRCLWFRAGALLCLAVLAGGCQKKIDLPISLEEGKKVTYLVTNSVETDMSMPMMQGMKMNQVETREMELEFEVTGSDGTGGAEVKATFLSAAYTAGGTGPLAQAGNMNPMSKIFPAMKGAELTFHMDSKGNVSEVGGVDKMVEAMSEKADEAMKEMNLPPQMTGGMDVKAMVRDQLKEQFSRDSMRQMIEGVLITRPAEPVADGGTWTENEEIAGVMPISMTYNCTLQYGNGGRNIINSNSTAEAAEGSGMMGMDFTLSGSGSHKAELDPLDGWTESISGSIEFEGKMSLKQKIPGMDSDIPVTITQTLSVIRS